MDLLGHIVGLIGYKRPLLTFGVPGTILIFSGIFIGTWALSTYNIYHQLPFGPSVISALMLVLGFLLVTSSLILNSIIGSTIIGSAIKRSEK